MARPHTMTRLQRLTYRVWLAVGVVVLAAVTLYLAYRPLAVIVAPVLFALLIVYLLNPAVNWLQRRRVPRLLGTALTYLGVFALLAGVAILVVPLLSRQVSEFARAAPDLGVAFTEGARSLAERFGLVLDVEALVDTQELAQRVQQFVTEAENRETVLALLVGLSGLARGAFFVLLTLAIGPVIAFYVLVDLPRFKTVSLRLIPPRHRAEAVQVGRKLATVVGGFVRGQLLIAAIVGLAASLALAAVGLRFWLVVGVIAGVTNLVPLLGPWVAGLLGFTLALLTDGLGLAVLVALVLVAVQQLDSSVLSPLIMGRTVRVHPLGVLLAILVAATLYGVFGMLVAVPLVAAVKALAEHVWQTRVPWADIEEQGEAPRLAAPDGEPAAGSTASGATDGDGERSVPVRTG